MKNNTRKGWKSSRLLLLYYGWRNPATPWYAKLTAIAALLYLFSPVDIIPDVIPVAGLIDDVVVTPLLLSLAGRMLPPLVRETAARKAAATTRQIRWVIITVVVFLAGLIILWIKKDH